MSKIAQRAKSQESTWGKCYHIFPRIIDEHGLRVGVEVGVGYGGHAESILLHSKVETLYGVDPYSPTGEMGEEVYSYVMSRLSQFGPRYQHIRKKSVEATGYVPDSIDFVYIDALHDYAAVMADLRAWYGKVRVGGIVAGHDHKHVGVRRAIDEFFGLAEVALEPHEVWWFEKG